MMETVQLSAQGKEYSRLIAGVMRWGVWGSKLNTSQVATLIEECCELGITSFDHADIYGDYTTEAEFGQALKHSKIDRNKIQIITKCGIRMLSTNRPNNLIKSYDTSYDYIIQSVDKSLENLKTDYIDLLLIHRPSPLMHPEIVAKAFSHLKDSGKVLEFGVSNFTQSQFELIHQETPIVTNQVEASLLKLDPFIDGTFDQCIQHKIKPMAWSPLAGASLFGHISDKEKLDQRTRLVAIANQYDWDLSSMAYAFLLKHPSKILPVLGTSSLERIKLASDSCAIEISDEQWFQIWSASTGQRVA